MKRSPTRDFLEHGLGLRQQIIAQNEPASIYRFSQPLSSDGCRINWQMRIDDFATDLNRFSRMVAWMDRMMPIHNLVQGRRGKPTTLGSLLMVASRIEWVFDNGNQVEVSESSTMFFRADHIPSEKPKSSVASASLIRPDWPYHGRVTVPDASNPSEATVLHDMALPKIRIDPFLNSRDEQVRRRMEQFLALTVADYAGPLATTTLRDIPKLAGAFEQLTTEPY